MSLRLAFALTLALTAAAEAADTSGAYAVDGLGSRRCADLTAAFAGKDQVLLGGFAAWTDGFITGYNVSTPGTFDVTPWQTVELTLARLDAYCRGHGEEPFIEALGKLIAVMRDGRLETADELVLLRQGKQGVYVYSTMLGRISAALTTAGFAVKTPPGRFDPDFAAALQAFQKSKGIPESGLPDQPTLNALLN